MFITVFDDAGSTDVCTFKHRGLRALYEIATLPPEDRTRGHTLKSGETKTPDEMTVRELREVKAALKAEREARASVCLRFAAVIRRFNLVTKCYDQQRELLEDLPVSLTYEIAAPSAESTEPKRQAAF
ncbi:hypothetical protein [Paenibacillus durus]|uniref:hypothetical protein n=1 Tax=Paenibacillus durus TaxID=44251 RepID=UPI00046F988A|nr:hypothetical protein [Paenibacillus durus]